MVPQLYLLTNDDDFAALYQKLEIAFDSGIVALLQIRRKQLLKQPEGGKKLYQESEKLIALAERCGVSVVMNDDIEMAKNLGIGVHLGQSDGKVIDARQQLGRQAIIGRTCHQSSDLVKQAKLEGASYAAMGAVFASSTKPQASIVSVNALKEGCDQNIDICVIGGISSQNVTQLSGLPIRYIAVVADILSAPIDQVHSRTLAWQQALSHWP